MNVKSYFSSLTLFFLLILILLTSVSGSLGAEEIMLNDEYFNIMPKIIDENTLIALEKIEELIAISEHRIEEDRFLLIYKGRFYLLQNGSKIIETENGKFSLPSEVLYINDKLLVPIYLLDILPGIEFKENGVLIIEN